MPNSVVIDARKLGDGGIGVYIENLIDGLIDSKVFDSIKLIVDPRFENLRWNGLVELIQETSGKYSLAEYFLMPIKLRKYFVNSIIHFPHYTVPFFLPKTSKVIVTIHDCIHLKSKSPLKRSLAKFLIAWALKRADRVITVSNYSKSEILNNFPKITRDKIDVIPNSLPRDFLNLKSKNDGNYLLFVGNGKEHKGLDLVLSKWGQEKLLIVGSAFTEKQIEKINNNPNIVLIGSCSRKELLTLYEEAKALIMPSLEEGFGIPVLEALAIGLPVVATPLPCFKEWFEDSLWYAKDFNVDSIVEAINLMNQDSEARNKKSKIGLELVSSFLLSKVCIKILETYKKIIPSLDLDTNLQARRVA